MSPYRHPPEIAPRAELPRRHDDAVLGVLLVAIGGLRVAIALATGECWGGEASIAAILVVLGVLLAFARS